jgi:hypothetical protein
MIFGNTTTHQDRLAAEMRRINGLAIVTYRQLVTQHRALMEAFWANPNGFTPQEVFDKYGTNAVSIFIESSVMLTFISGREDILGIPVEQRYVVVIPFNYTINPDGTVTVGEPITVPES